MNFDAGKKLYKLSKLGGEGGEVIWTKSKRKPSLRAIIIIILILIIKKISCQAPLVELVFLAVQDSSRGDIVNP